MQNKDVKPWVAASTPKGGSLKRSLGMAEADVPFGSNSIRLSLGEWLVAAIIFAVLFCLAPVLWERAEKFEPGPDYRVQYKLGSDYWHFQRYCKWACSRHETLVVGDSVIWGHYVSKDNTLSHHLNELACPVRDPKEKVSNRAGRLRRKASCGQFANLGVDGTCPAVLEGLLRYYGRDIVGKNVILHFNPLWMSSPKHDLQTEEEHHFNHAKLVPQFFPRIPCYKASCSERISAVVQRYVPFLNWTAHLNIAYFQGPGVPDIPAWTLVHPYENPLRPVTLRLPASDEYEKCRRISQPAGSRAKSAPDWVELKTSLQWRFFQRSIELLKARDNRVFVLVGPFNEHILKPESIETYNRLKGQIETWLRQNNVPHYVPPVLPARFYCDASHPLSDGYAELAKQLFENESFTKYLSRGDASTHLRIHSPSHEPRVTGDLLTCL